MTTHMVAARVLVILGKAPIAGVAKTRLAPPLILSEAAAVARAALTDMIAIARAVPGCAVMLAHPCDATDVIRAVVGPDAPPMIALPPHETTDVGAAMHAAMARAFAAGARQVALIGSDLPSLPPAHIADAFGALDRGADVVLGPAEDGGYYLVATAQPRPELFTGIAWSTPAVFDQTVARARGCALALATIPEWYDIDSAPALLRCAHDLAAMPMHPARATRAFLAIILPRLLAGGASEGRREAAVDSRQ